VLLPRQRIAAPDHRAAEIASARAGAPGGGPGALRRAVGQAPERRCLYKHVTGRRLASWAAEQLDQVVAGGAAARLRAGMPRPAAFVDLPSGDPRQPDLRPLRAPDRTVTVPYVGRGARERGAGRDDGSRDDKRDQATDISCDGKGEASEQASAASPPSQRS
jgi:hypothetical protein